MTTSTGYARQILAGDRGIWVQVRLDGVNAVAVGANRRLPVAASDRLAMNALHELLLDGLVTFGTGRRHVELEDRRLGVTGGKNFMRSVAVGAHCSLLRTPCDRLAVHALQVGVEGPRTVAAGFHHEFLTVATAAGSWNICV